MDKFTDRLAFMMQEKGLRQADLVKDMGMSKSSISTLCSGKVPPQPRTIKIICSTYGINEDWLLNGNGEMDADNSDIAVLAELTKKILDMENPLVFDFIKTLCRMSDKELKTYIDLARAFHQVQKQRGDN